MAGVGQGLERRLRPGEGEAVGEKVSGGRVPGGVSTGSGEGAG